MTGSPRVTAAKSRSETAVQARRMLRILCAHPDEDARVVLDLALSLDRDTALTVVRSGVEAILSASATQYGLIVLDGRLEDMNCYEVCRWLKADPRAGAVPVVILLDPRGGTPMPPRDVTILACLPQPVDARLLAPQLRAALAAAPHQKK